MLNQYAVDYPTFPVFLCEHETTLFTPAFVDPASSHMPVLYTCTSHDHSSNGLTLAQVAS